MGLEEKLEELGIDKGQLIIFSVIGLVVIFLIYGLLKGKSEEKQIVLQQIVMPENKAAIEYQTKLDAYARENEPKINEQSLNFDRDILGETAEKTKKQALEERIDSMLASKSFTPKAFKKKKRVKQQRTNNQSLSDNKRELKQKERDRKREQKELAQLVKDQEQERKENAQEKKEELEREKIKERERLQGFFNNSNINSTNNLSNTKNLSELKTDKNIDVMVNGDQTLKKGNRINMLLSKKAVINGIVYHKNTKIYGFVKFGEHRVFINISNINKNKVALDVYDAQDGDLGLYTKVNLTGEITKEVADENVDELEIGNVKIGNTIKKIFKKKNKVQKIEIFNRTKLVLN